jgi:hypothetical protein
VSAEAFAFVSGDLEPVYRGKIKKLRRNVLYIKPRTILIVDEAWPGEKDVEVNLLFHTRWKKDIAVEPDVVNFNKDRAVLYLYPLLPRSPLREVVSEPHFLCQYNVQPLIERGYLRISAETGGRKLVLANLLAAAKKGGGAPAIEISPSEDSTALRAVTENEEISLAVSSGDSVNLDDYASDGLILALSPGGSIFAADATHISRQRFKLWEAKDRFIGEISFQESKISGRVRFESPSVVTVKTASRPVEVKTNSRRRKDFAYDHQSGTLSLLFPAGESALEIILKE